LAEHSGSLLVVDGLVTGYGTKQVVGGVSLEVAPEEIVALIGHNGAGKSTLLKAVFGVLPIWKGAVRLSGGEVAPPTPRKLIGMGAAYVPQGNRVFGDLSVRENLEMGGVNLHDKRQLKERIENMLTLLPDLRACLRRRAGTLSGGEKQMLAIATGLIMSPRLLLLDEPSLGLAPARVTRAMGHIRQISQKSHVAVLIVEQKVREVLKIAHRVYVLRNGRVSFSGTTESLSDEARLRAVYL